MWEFEFGALKQMWNLNHLDSLPILDTLALDQIQVLFGGRTDNDKTYYKLVEGKAIQHLLPLLICVNWAPNNLRGRYKVNAKKFGNWRFDEM